MNLGTLRAELQARGYDYLSSARCTTLINMAVNEICNFMPWPFLEATSGPAVSPLTISNLARILSVTNVDGVYKTDLAPADRRFILQTDPNLEETGPPQVYWLEGNVVTVWPSSITDAVTVRYVQNPTDLSSDSDTPLIPTGYHDLIIHGAHCQALIDNDDWQGYQVVRQIWQDRMNQMVQAIMGRDLGGPTLMTVTDPRDY